MCRPTCFSVSLHRQIFLDLFRTSSVSPVRRGHESNDKTHPLLTPLVPLEVLLHWSGMSLTQSEAQDSKTFVLTQDKMLNVQGEKKKFYSVKWFPSCLLSRAKKKNTLSSLYWYPLTESTVKSIKGIESVWSVGVGFVCMSGLPDRKAIEEMEKNQRRQRRVCWSETPPLTSLSSVLNSKLFWEAGVLPALPLSFYKSRFWFGRFVAAGSGAFLPLLARRCVSVGAANCEILCSRLFWQVSMCLWLTPLTLPNKSPDHRTMWNLHVVKIMKVDI